MSNKIRQKQKFSTTRSNTICAVVCEYNPLHNGHIYQLQKARELSGCDAIMCVMSGNFVQRAEPAILDKYARAELAVKHGADIVIELPAVFATSTSDNFAHGAIAMLAGIQAVTHLSFGCEADNPDDIIEAADILPRPDFVPYFRRYIDSGISYASAVSAAYKNYTGRKTDILDAPNNMLALHYIAAINKLGANIKPVPVKRTGCNHNDLNLSGGEFSSATAIRKIISQDTGAQCAPLQNAMPPDVLSVIQNTRHFPSQVKYDAIATHVLRNIPSEYAAQLQDVSEGLHNKLLKSAQTHNTVEQIITATKSKRYTHSRIARIILNAVLGISRDIHTAALDAPPYYRVLAIKKESADILAALPEPTIIKNSDFKKLVTHPAIDIDTAACNLYTNLTGSSCGGLYSNANLLL